MKAHKWKSVPIDTSSIPAEELAFLSGIEELNSNSYELVRPGQMTKSGTKRKAKSDATDNKVKTSKKKKKRQKINTKEDSSVQSESENLDMSAWSFCSLHEELLNNLRSLGFQKPTQIQQQTIPLAMERNQDILGAAETGSGKTLAFGLPILNAILSIKQYRLNNSSPSESDTPLYSLILTPTRELAIQVKNHLVAVSKKTDIKISVVVGGISAEKQRRLLKKRPEIIVATPGRLWELYEEGEEHVSQISNVRFLVIDEADRMVEKGHFAELTQILDIINGSERSRKRQTFVFSATLTLVHDLPTRLATKVKKGKMQQKQKLSSLIRMIGLEDPKVVDITKKSAVAETLTESQITCSNEEKDSYLYYFLVKHPGRTLIFCNSIECVRRLRTVLELLNCNPLPLHASMPQRQRLKNLERFEKSANGVLLATDVAARGLDIKGIEHVIHFQVPRTAETYVHRSGRTARAQNEGLSLILIEPQDITVYRKICKTLEKSESLPAFPVDHKIFKLASERVTLARSIDKMEHRMKRMTAQNRWFQNAAKDMDMELDEDDLLHNIGDAREVAAKQRQLKSMKKQLTAMLSKNIVTKILTGCYPTKSGKLLTIEHNGQEKAIKVAKGTKKQKIKL